MAELLEAVDADNFVTAVVTDPADWRRVPLTTAQWEHLFAVLDEIEAITTAHQLRHVVHPHVNTLVETSDELDRVLDGVADVDLPRHRARHHRRRRPAARSPSGPRPASAWSISRTSGRRSPTGSTRASWA